VKELAVDRIPVAVTCRVLKLCRQPYHRWLADPVTPSEVVEAYRTDALFDAHRDDPEFGHRLLADAARDAGESMADRTAWRITSANGWWSAFVKKRGRNGKKPGPAVHDDLYTVTDANGRTRHEFTADGPNQLWLTDITEHRTSTEGKLYLRAVKDVFSNRDRGVLDRLQDEVEPGRQRSEQRRPDARQRRRLRGSQRPRISISKQEVSPRSDRPPHGRIHGAGSFVRG
jgi:putative transposase